MKTSIAPQSLKVRSFTVCNQTGNLSTKIDQILLHYFTDFRSPLRVWVPSSLCIIFKFGPFRVTLLLPTHLGPSILVILNDCNAIHSLSLPSFCWRYKHRKTLSSLYYIYVCGPLLQDYVPLLMRTPTLTRYSSR